MKKSVFRKVSLERLSSPEQLDLLMRVTNPKSWLALVAFGSVLVVAALWGINGRVPVQIVSPVIFMPPGGMKNVISLYQGQVSDVMVSPGDVIAPGQQIAEITSVGNGVAQPVISLHGGRVMELRTGIGQLVEPGTVITSLEPSISDKPLEAIAYLSRTDAQRLTPGMTVKLAPETVQTRAYGFLLGRVMSVGEFPITWQNIVNDIGNEQLARAVVNADAPIMVRIAILEDDTTATGWQWTTSSGPDFVVSSGTLGTAMIMVDWQRPVQLLFASN